MIIYASKNFITKLKCSISLSKHQPTEMGAFDGWTADTLKVSKVELVAVMMHDVSLATVIIPLRGIQSLAEFVPVFRRNVGDLLRGFGATMDETDQKVLVLRRTNRPLIGTLHDAKRLIEAEVIEQLDNGRPVSWNQAADFINRTPFSVIDDRTSVEALTEFISSYSS